jgi:aldose 1-epimerase
MEIYSDQPGIQFYSGNFMDGSLIGKHGKRIEYRNGIALEPQHFPDSPNQPKYPNTILSPGEKYSNTIIYKFKTDN